MSEFEKKDFLYEGKAKKLYSTSDPQKLIVEYKDDLTAFNAKKKGSFEGKGRTNLEITDLIFSELKEKGIQTHYLQKLSDQEILVEKVKIIPLEVVIRNRAAGSICTRLGLDSGWEFTEALFEIFYKKDELNDPLITEDHALLLGLCSSQEYQELKKQAFKINSILQEIFDRAGIILVDFKIEFGFDSQGRIILADEISPDSCRLWDKETMEILDKDRFRKDLGDVDVFYKDILNRLKKAI